MRKLRCVLLIQTHISLQVLLKNETLTPAKCLHIGDNKKKDAQGAVVCLKEKRKEKKNKGEKKKRSDNLFIY